MTTIKSTLDWIDNQRDRMVALVEQWCHINSGSFNVAGLHAMGESLLASFSGLGGHAELLDLQPHERIDSSGHLRKIPLGRAIRIIKRLDAPLRVFLGIHMDTVYSDVSTRVEHIDGRTLRGPGVADAKGGLAVMLVALEALERSGLAESSLGWEVLINPDEEIGSPGSISLLNEAANRNHLGLVFEPTLPDGSFVGSRKGSGNYTAVVHGRSAHAGRDFAAGRNAIVAMAEFITWLDGLNHQSPKSTPASKLQVEANSSRSNDGDIGVTVNIGVVEGGSAVNVVADRAVCRFNVRMVHERDVPMIQAWIDQAVATVRRRDSIRIELHGGITSPPKPMDNLTRQIFDHLAACGDQLDIPIRWLPSGGVCDGNKLAAAGLPTIDTLGPRGGGLHSPQEYLLLDSLTERAKLSALLLMKLASGQIDWPMNI